MQTGKIHTIEFGYLKEHLFGSLTVFVIENQKLTQDFLVIPNWQYSFLLDYSKVGYESQKDDLIKTLAVHMGREEAKEFTDILLKRIYELEA